MSPGGQVTDSLIGWPDLPKLWPTILWTPPFQLFFFTDLLYPLDNHTKVIARLGFKGCQTIDPHLQVELLRAVLHSSG